MIGELNPQELIAEMALELKAKELVQIPEWAYFVKTGVSRQRPPVKDDWWYMRTASVLRAVYMLGPIGVSKLRIKYGGRMNRGHKPQQFRKGSGKIIRIVLQQLESAQLIKQIVVDGHKGRCLTKKGKDFLKSTAAKLVQKQKQR